VVLCWDDLGLVLIPEKPDVSVENLPPSSENIKKNTTTEHRKQQLNKY